MSNPTRPPPQERAAALFALAVEKPSTERPALLQAVCSEDPTLNRGASRTQMPMTLERQSGRNDLPMKPRTPLTKTARSQTLAARLFLLLLLLALPAVVQAQFTYTTNNGAITITGGNCFDGAVAIPDTIDGLPVTSIGDQAFLYRTSLTTVTIPNSVTSIGGYALYSGCTGLTGLHSQGGSPALDSPDSTSEGAGQVTVYYLQGSTGRGTTFRGRPTALWLPRVRTDTASFGVRNSELGFDVSWAPGKTVVVEATTDLANPVWPPLQTLNLTGDSINFSDPQSTLHPVRVYRLLSP